MVDISSLFVFLINNKKFGLRINVVLVCLFNELNCCLLADFLLGNIKFTCLIDHFS